ncbi:MAG: ACT domain-containing protein [Varibaculum sp.]|nr:ACT domain-containing protein [Varibaculum sp.]
MNQPIESLTEILASLTIVNAGNYIYSLTNTVPEGATPLAIVHEAEGISIIIPVHQAQQAGLETSEVFTCLTLNVHSSLTSVGLTALVSRTLAEAHIPCNVIAGYYHDHLLIPAAQATQAEQLLAQLATKTQ